MESCVWRYARFALLLSIGLASSQAMQMPLTAGPPATGKGSMPRSTGARPMSRQGMLEKKALVSQGTRPWLLLSQNSLSVTGHFQAGLNAVAEANLYWNLADFAAPAARFDSDTEWFEAYAKPGLSFEFTRDPLRTYYGKVSGVASGTLGVDAFDASDTGRVTLEEGYLGARTQAFEEDASWDFSVGPRELKLGTGMLVANGGQNGFERGSLKFGPRKSWGFAALAKRKAEDLTTTFFYLDANELASNNTRTTLTGVDLRLDTESRDYLGATLLYVPTSGSPYPQAAFEGAGPPVILPGAREGLNAINTYLRVAPLEDSPDVFITADIAYEHNDRIALKAWAGRIQAGKTLSRLPMKPRFVYSFQTFTGDDPATRKLERFDPLFFEGSPSSWATGSKSALVFINSNVNAHQFALTVKPTKKDTVALRYSHIRANELLSPLQFGQATRVELENGTSTVISGVSDAHVSDDFFIEYNRVIDPNTFLTAGLSVSVPGRGIRLVAPGNTPAWTGGFVNVVVNY